MFRRGGAGSSPLDLSFSGKEVLAAVHQVSHILDIVPLPRNGIIRTFIYFYIYIAYKYESDAVKYLCLLYCTFTYVFEFTQNQIIRSNMHTVQWLYVLRFILHI
jgi:hypothetical protein